MMKADVVKKRAEQFHAKFDTELAGEYERLSEYKGSHEPLTARHIPCGVVRTSPARDFFRKGCNVCSRKQAAQKRAQDRAVGYIEQIEADYDVTAISGYKRAREPVKWRCNKCGAIIERTVENILWRPDYGGGMKHDCYKLHKRLVHALKIELKNRLAQIEAQERKAEHEARMQAEIDALCNKYRANGYSIIKVYDDLQRVVLQHLECGRKYTTTKSIMKKGYGCRVCAKKGLSFGAQQVRTYLEVHSIPYEREVCFDGCKAENHLPFDFVLYDANGKPTHAIEYNGEQHYEPVKAFGGDDKFREIVAADKIKAEWCKANGLPLLSIRYDADVSDELNKFLCKEKRL